MRKLITDEQPVNPKYYEKMSELLGSLIKQRREQAIEYEEYLRRMVELAGQVQNPAGGATYPPTINTPARRALYDNLGNNEALANDLDIKIRQNKKDSWRGSKIKEKEVRFVINSVLKDESLTNEIFEIVKNQGEY